MKIAVIGGGASGMFASIFAASNGADVTLYEKNDKLGKKIYITGKGRCNVTNVCDEVEFLSNIPTNKNFMYSSIYAFNSYGTLDFFNDNGTTLKIERGNRAFPVSDKASDITKSLEKALIKFNAKICLNSNILGITKSEKGYLLHTITDIVEFDRVIIACGGLSYPTTGSNGDGYKFAKSLGHKIIEPKPALSEIMLRQDVSTLEGLSLKNVVLSAKTNKGKTIFSQMGEMLFTKNGISGPIALSCSSFINKYNTEEYKLYIDLKPALAIGTGANKPSLDERILKDFTEFANKDFCNSLNKLLPSRMAEYIVGLSGIEMYKKVNQITTAERQVLVKLMKNLTFDVPVLGKIENAIVTSGGVDVKEVNPKTMESKLHKGLYFCGEVLDVDALTGGFNLQIAFSTGYVAGLSASLDV